MKTAVFKNGNSQAVRIPKEMRISAKTVDIIKEGDDKIVIHIHPKNPWDLFREGIKELQDIEWPEREVNDAGNIERLDW